MISGRWTRLVGCVIAILLGAFVVLPLVQRLSPIREVRSAMQAADIDATALFYTESETSADSESSLRNALRFRPFSRDE
jgi:hypothetical protein